MNEFKGCHVNAQHAIAAGLIHGAAAEIAAGLQLGARFEKAYLMLLHRILYAGDGMPIAKPRPVHARKPRPLAWLRQKKLAISEACGFKDAILKAGDQSSRGWLMAPVLKIAKTFAFEAGANVCGDFFNQAGE